MNGASGDIVVILLAVLNISVIVSGFFLQRFVKQTDKRLYDLEHYGCAYCQTKIKSHVS